MEYNLGSNLWLARSNKPSILIVCFFVCFCSFVLAVYLLFCAREMKAKFAEFRPLFSRKFHDKFGTSSLKHREFPWVKQNFPAIFAKFQIHRSQILPERKRRRVRTDCKEALYSDSYVCFDCLRQVFWWASIKHVRVKDWSKPWKERFSQENKQYSGWKRTWKNSGLTGKRTLTSKI